MLKAPRPLRIEEVEQLLARNLVASLATIDASGFPHITPLWFVWAEDAFWMTSLPDRPHLRRIASNAKAGISINTELPEREDRERPNQQVRAIGRVELSVDDGEVWTRRIRAKYLHDAPAEESPPAPSSATRSVMRLAPERILAVARCEDRRLTRLLVCRRRGSLREMAALRIERHQGERVRREGGVRNRTSRPVKAGVLGRRRSRPPRKRVHATGPTPRGLGDRSEGSRLRRPPHRRQVQSAKRLHSWFVVRAHVPTPAIDLHVRNGVSGSVC